MFRFVIWLASRFRAAPRPLRPAQHVDRAGRGRAVRSGTRRRAAHRTARGPTVPTRSSSSRSPAARRSAATLVPVLPAGREWTAVIAIISWCSGARRLGGHDRAVRGAAPVRRPHLPHVTFGWPWSSSTTTNTLVGPLVLQKIEGIDTPALGTTNFDFLFTRKVTQASASCPCWYSATFYAVGKASATVDLNPGPAWWNRRPATTRCTMLSQPAGAPRGAQRHDDAPPPQLPQSVHDVSVDNTLSGQVASDHSWTYPGLGCGVIIRPQFAQSVLYAQAQSEAFTQATTDKRHPAADRRSRERSQHDHRRQLHHPGPGRARLYGYPLFPSAWCRRPDSRRN